MRRESVAALRARGGQTWRRLPLVPPPFAQRPLDPSSLPLSSLVLFCLQITPILRRRLALAFPFAGALFCGGLRVSTCRVHQVKKVVILGTLHAAANVCAATSSRKGCRSQRGSTVCEVCGAETQQTYSAVCAAALADACAKAAGHLAGMPRAPPCSSVPRPSACGAAARGAFSPRRYLRPQSSHPSLPKQASSSSAL